MGKALDLLAADPAETPDSDVYGHLIGSWEIQSTWYDAEGNERRGRGEWHFDRILGGLGVQDVLFAEGSSPREYGTSLRTYDAGTGTWHVVWMQPCGGEFAALLGRREGDEIVQEGHPLGDAAGRLERWRFVDVTDDAFTWLGEASTDGGRTWALEQRMDGRRMRA